MGIEETYDSNRGDDGGERGTVSNSWATLRCSKNNATKGIYDEINREHDSGLIYYKPLE